MKKVLAIVLALVMVFALAACGSTNEPAPAPAPDNGSSADAPADTAEETVTLKIGHMRAEGSPTDEDVKAFCEKVTEESNGSIQFEVYANSTLGDYTAMIERMGIGDVDMMLAAIGTGLDKKFGIATMPYLVSTWEEAADVFAIDGLVVQTMAECAEANDVSIIGTYPMYFGGIGLAKAPTADITKLENQGIKIRIPASAAFDAMATAFGFMATPLNYSDIFTSMQTGVVDGTIGGGAEGYYNDFRELLTDYLAVNDHFEMQWLCIGHETKNKLSENQLAIIEENAKWLQDKRWKEAQESQANFEKMLEDQGVTVHSFTNEELDSFKAQIRAAAWPTAVKEDLGDELYATVCDLVGYEG